MSSLHSLKLERSELLPSSIAKVEITPQSIFWFSVPLNYTIWFNLPMNIICIFLFVYAQVEFKFETLQNDSVNHNLYYKNIL
jgi:hypothetical protein